MDNLDKFLEQSKIHFGNNQAKRMMTCFVHAIDQIERTFGPLWGEDLEDDAVLSDEQAKWEDAFTKIRKRIFDNGNAQIRKMFDDLAEYDVKSKGPIPK